MPELLFKEEVYAIAGAAMEVYYQLGTGFLEAVYHEALQMEMQRRHIPFESQKSLTINYKDQPLKTLYVPDIICYNQIIIELKVLERLSGLEEAQIINYLKISKLRVGLLMNFGARPKLEWKRYVL